MDKINKLKSWINESKNIVVFSGAGMSCPSGIPDFRSSNGIYSEKFKSTFRPEEVISHTFFVNYPELFYEFYFTKMVYKDALPNLSHKYFKKLEATKNITVVTQNIDGLDKKAGIKNVYEIHGTIWENYCTKCHKFYSLDDIDPTKVVPHCSCGGIIKPNVVLYEEGLDNKVINGAINAIANADMLIVIGTSLIVYPAASFINYYDGCKLVIINKSSTPGDNFANLVINDDIINVIKELEKWKME